MNDVENRLLEEMLKWCRNSHAVVTTESVEIALRAIAIRLDTPERVYTHPDCVQTYTMNDYLVMAPYT